jgi:hypothetical protein
LGGGGGYVAVGIPRKFPSLIVLFVSTIKTFLTPFNSSWRTAKIPSFSFRHLFQHCAYILNPESMDSVFSYADSKS